jgi:hypothetical protein
VASGEAQENLILWATEVIIGPPMEGYIPDSDLLRTFFTLEAIHLLQKIYIQKEKGVLSVA